MKNIILLLGLFLSINYSLTAQWANGQNAAYVVGQPDFTTFNTGETNKDFYFPYQIAIDYTNHKLYVTDYGNYRVLRFAYPITSNYPAAERVFGVTGSPYCSRKQMMGPCGVAVYNGTLWVTDADNSRILKFNNAHLAATDSPDADGVLGQPDFTSSDPGTTASNLYYPQSLSIDASGNLWVVDRFNQRVLKYNNASNKANGASSDLVLGQPDFTSNSSGTTQSTMNSPYGVFVSGTTVWVADLMNSRVLRFDNPNTNGASADGVLGQSTFTTNAVGYTNSLFDLCCDVCVDPAGTLYVMDYNNHRVLIFNNAAAKPNGSAADFVLGQPDFTSNATHENQSGLMWGSVAVDAVNKVFLFSDMNFQRILIFGASSPLPVELKSFTAVSNGNGVSLNWKTATEVNNFGFDVERKSNDAGSEWVKVGFVIGSGNSNSAKEYSFTESNIIAGKYSYRLKQIDRDGGAKYSSEVEVEIKPIPTEYVLQQNYPNPFNPSTVIKFSLPFDSRVSLKIYNLAGQEVKVLKDEVISAGAQEVQFKSQGLTSGVYFYRLNAESLDGKHNYTSVKKMTFLK